jgi:hypothetical protein
MVRKADMPTPKLTNEIIIAAIQGFEFQKTSIDGKIAELRAMLPGGPAETADMPEPTKPKRRVSAAARRKMALAQKARWAKVRGEAEPAPKEAPKPKRRVSKEGLARIIAATKKRWARVKAEAKKEAPKAAPKRKLSPARKAALVANLKKARAAKAVKKTAGEAVPF